LWRVEPLLCSDRKMRKCTRNVSRKPLGKQVPKASNQRSTMKVLLETEVSIRSVPRSCEEDNWGDRVRGYKWYNPVWRLGRIPPP
jgi:hypothetical protein